MYRTQFLQGYIYIDSGGSILEIESQRNPKSSEAMSATTNPKQPEIAIRPATTTLSQFVSPESRASLDEDNAGGKKKKTTAGAKRRKVNHACLYCRRSHMTCDEGRPCQRW